MEPAELIRDIEDGTVDTVLTVFPDLQGRLMGKRVTGHFFVDEVLEGEGGVHACNYLLAVDVDMTPLPGYRFANWEQGYGDVMARPDLATLRPHPVDREDRARALRPRRRGERRAGRGVAPADPPAPGRAGRSGRATGSRSAPSWSSSCSGTPTTRPRPSDYRDLTPHSHLHRGLPHPPDDQGRVPDPPDPQRHGRRRTCRWSSPRARPGAGQHEINLAYADALEMADRHTVYKNGAKEIAALNDRSLTFMAKWSMDEVGSSCHLHSSLWSADDDRCLTARRRRAGRPQPRVPPLPRRAPGRRPRAGVVRRPHVNSYKRYLPDSWAPTTLVWGRRQPHLRVAARRPRRLAPGRSPASPAPTATPTSPTRRPSPPASTGSSMRSSPGRRSRATPTRRPTCPGCRRRSSRPSSCSRHSDLACAAFGEEVHHHLAEHRPPGVAGGQPRRHRLGAAPRLRAPLGPILKRLLARRRSVRRE